MRDGNRLSCLPFLNQIKQFCEGMMIDVNCQEHCLTMMCFQSGRISHRPLMHNLIITLTTMQPAVIHHTHPPMLLPKPHPLRSPPHLITFSTHFSSTLLTSSLNLSTSCQQSNGRRSFPLKHLTTSSLAFSTSLSSAPTSTTFFRFSSLYFRSSIEC